MWHSCMRSEPPQRFRCSFKLRIPVFHSLRELHQKRTQQNAYFRINSVPPMNVKKKFESYAVLFWMKHERDEVIQF